MQRVLFLLIVAVVAVHAFNKTHFPAPHKRHIADANAGGEWYVRLPAPASWPDVMAMISALSGTCSVRSVTQTQFQTSMVLVCADLTGEQIQALINSAVAPLLGVANVGGLVATNDRVQHADVAAVSTVTTQSNAPVQLDVMDTPVTSGPAYAQDTLFHYTLCGTGIRTYTVDTGAKCTHAELSGRCVAWLNTLDGGSAVDGHGHGTHVASLIVGTTYGPAKCATLYAVKALDDEGYGTVSSVCDAIDAILDECLGNAAARPSVINLSLNGPKSSAIDSALLQLAQQCPCVIVVAAGNNAENACLSSPAGTFHANSHLTLTP